MGLQEGRKGFKIYLTV